MQYAFFISKWWCYLLLMHRCPKYPTSIYPVASAIDTPLPVPVQRSHIMTGSKPEWIIVPPQQAANGERDFVNYPDEGIEQWHKKHKLSV